MSCSRTQRSDAGEALPVAPQSRVMHSTTEPLCSLNLFFILTEKILKYFLKTIHLKNAGLTLKTPITTAAKKKFCSIFPSFSQKKGMIFQENCLMKYHALFVIFLKSDKI